MKAEYDTETKRMKLSNDLDSLDNMCRKILGLSGTGSCLTVPANFLTEDAAPQRFKVRLWKFGFLDESHLKGPAQSYAVSLGSIHVTWRKPLIIQH